MTQISEAKETHGTDALVDEFIERGVERVGEEALKDVEVKQHGRWLVLKGRVGSAGLKARLIGMVPKVKGARWVIDKLRVARDATRYIKH